MKELVTHMTEAKKELTITSNAGATYSSGWRDDTVYTIGSENVTINILEEVKSIIIGDGVTQIGENVIYAVFLICPAFISVKMLPRLHW